jgi:O-antigen/teichoic acid export membrane protein
MRKKILSTFFTRIIVAMCSLAVLILTSRVLGAHERGVISLMLLAITISVLINEVVGGPALVYFVPRSNTKHLLATAFSWSAIVSVAVPVILKLLDLIPDGYVSLIILACIFQNISGVSMLFQLGRQNSKRYNIIAGIQSITTVLLLVLFIWIFNIRTAQSWIYSFIGAQLLASIVGLIMLANSPSEENENKPTLRKILSYGSLIQLSTLAYILSTRISYYFLDRVVDTDAVGVFSTGVSVIEAALLFSGSVALITYSKISNSTDEKENIEMTVKLSKISFLVTVPALLLALLLPVSFYTFIFGEQFSSIKSSMIWLVPGVAMISMSTVFTHYFSGNALYKINAIASVLGFVNSTIAAYIFIPRYGITGAAITSCIGYITSSIFTIYYFRNHITNNTALFPSLSDIRGFLEGVRKS